MNKKITLLIGSVLCMMGLFTFAPMFATIPIVHAQPSGSGNGVQEGLSTVGDAFPNGAKENLDVGAVIKKIIDWALYLAAVIAVIFIIYGGFLYITSAGDATQATKGRTSLVNALIGLAMVVLSYLIVQVVYNFLVNR